LLKINFIHKNMDIANNYNLQYFMLT